MLSDRFMIENMGQHWPKLNAHCNQFFELIIKFESIWNGVLGCISFVQYCIRLASNQTRPVLITLTKAGRGAHKLEKIEIKKVWRMGVIQQAETNWPAPIGFVPKEGSSLRFLLDYKKLNGITACNIYKILKWVRASIHLESQWSSSHSMHLVAIEMSRSSNLTVSKQPLLPIMSCLDLL